MSDVTAVTPGVAAAAAWWAERLGTVQESALHYKPARYSDEERERFRVALEEAITAHLRGDVPELREHLRRAVRYDNHENVVYTDYEPDDTLCAAAEAAGIILYDGLPGKTMMIFRETGITVSEGYGAPYVTVWEPGQ